MRRACLRFLKVSVTAGLALTATTALAGTTAEIRYYPPGTPAEAGGEGYSLYIVTDAKEDADGPDAQIVLSCSAFADGVSLELMGQAAIALPVLANDPQKPGELHPAHFAAGAYDATVSLDWMRWSENDIDGVFTSSDDLLAFEQAFVSEAKLRAEAFGHGFDFDLAAVADDLGKYLQGCYALVPAQEQTPGGPAADETAPEAAAPDAITPAETPPEEPAPADDEGG
jgi:hypothetical protein